MGGQWNWFGVRMNIVALIFVILGVSSCILLRNSDNKIMLAIVLSNVLSLNEYILHGLFMMGLVDIKMINI